MDLILKEAVQHGEQTSLDPIIVMIVGMAVVFLGLVILIGVVKLVNLACRALFGEKKPKKSREPEPQKQFSTAPSKELTDAQRGEIIAAVSAAIAENMGKPVSGIRIRSIRRVG